MPLGPVCVCRVLHYANKQQCSQLKSSCIILCSSARQLNSKLQEPQPSCWSTFTDVNHRHATASRFQATAHISRHHRHTHCETSGELTWKTRAMITDNVGNYSACCLFFKCISVLSLYMHVWLWWKQERVQHISQVKVSWRTRDTWPEWQKLMSTNLQRKWHWSTSLGALYCHWASPVQQSDRAKDWHEQKRNTSSSH